MLTIRSVVTVLSAILVASEAHSQLLPAPLLDSDFHEFSEDSAAKIELGRMLFFDKILSGNKNISCASCHHSFTGTADGLSVSVGEGGRGLSVARNTGDGKDAITERVPRNSPAIFNLSAKEFTVFFHDGRVSSGKDGAPPFSSPAGDTLPSGLRTTLAAQAMFPVTSPTEMAGNPRENTVANAAAAGDLAGPKGVWAQLAARLRAIPEYVTLFKNAYREIARPEDITFAHAANAIAAFEGAAWRSDNSPFDRYLRGDLSAMPAEAISGMQSFYGSVGCSSCHSGAFQTDHDFHSIAMPQLGPGKGDGPSGREDFGRERVTQNESDRYKFRTPSLRNVALTGPWGHSGAYATLEAVVRHHLDPVESLYSYDLTQWIVPRRADLDQHDFVVMNDPVALGAIAQSNELAPSNLTDRQVADILAFLNALTDSRSLDMRSDVPSRVPSGLSIFD